MSNTHATPEATQALSQAHPSVPYQPLGNTGLMVSAAGFGGYRVDVEVAEHHEALEKALLAGVNLVDTSSNYTDGNSERLVGAALGKLMGQGSISRDQVVVVSKAGYLQGQNFELSQQRKQEGRPFPELVEFGQGLEHCLHPEFLADQLTRSLERLGLKRLDVFLLHNPEYYLGWAAQQQMDLGQAREEYYRRLGQALAHLEDEARQGRISYHGISSNTFAQASDHPEFTSLARVWLLAQSLGHGHRFRVIQFPFNVLEPQALTRPNQPGGQSLLGQARQLRLGALGNRPLNALNQGRLMRLVEVQAGLVPTPDQVGAVVADLLASESEIKTLLFPRLALEEDQRQQLAEFLGAARMLSEHWPEFQGLEHWRSVQGEYLLPRVHAAMQFLAQALGEDQEAAGLIQGHLELLARALGTIEAVYRAATAQENKVLKARLALADPDWAQAPSLSQMAIRALRSTEGISSVLVGMRRPAYVDDVLAELARPVAQAPRLEAWRAMTGKAPA
ncbi:MAG: aldo/keto reductase [Desulfarculus sp.]|nr:aldo/keto reductase [Desulfarculus sp.]